MENSTGLDIRSGIREFWTWLEQGSHDHTETILEVDTHESNDDTPTVVLSHRMKQLKQVYVRTTLTLQV